MNKKHICLFTKDNQYCDVAVNFAKRNFSNLTIIKSNLTETMTEEISSEKYDYVIAFLYHKIIPEVILASVKVAAINFHPAPTTYAGAGSYSFALYNNEEYYGTTCHHMLATPDTGTVIAEKRFSLYPSDTLTSMKDRTMVYTLSNFFEVLDFIITDKDLPIAKEQWKATPYTQEEFREQLLELNFEMSIDEIDRKIRATAHPDYPGPFIEINGKRYTLRPEKSHTIFDFGK